MFSRDSSKIRRHADVSFALWDLLNFGVLESDVSSEVVGFETWVVFSGNEVFGVVVEVCVFFYMHAEGRKRVRR